MLPIIQEEIVQKEIGQQMKKYRLLCHRTMYSGIIAVNTATFIGYKEKGYRCNSCNSWSSNSIFNNYYYNSEVFQTFSRI